MKLFDAHCDTIEKLCVPGVSLYTNNAHCDLKRMEAYDGFLQIFACCVYPEYMGDDAFLRANRMIDAFQRQVAQNASHISLCCTVEEMDRVLQTGGTGGILALEGGSPLNRKLENLDYFYQKGVRLMTLTWNHRNELGVGAMTANDEGLTDFGKQVVERMNHLGMIVDVSHLSDAGFDDVCQCSQVPFVASHSNARRICNHPRNLMDDMIREIARRKGMIGVNLYPPFLTEQSEATVDHVVQHIEHILSVGGENCVGLGCDFDGIAVMPKDIRGVQDVGKIYNRLLQCNYSEGLVEKIMYRNFIAFLHNYKQYIKMV